MPIDMLQLQRLLNGGKVAHNWTGFERRDNQANFLIGTAQLTDLSGIFIPAVTLEIEVKPPIIVDRPTLLFSLRQRVGALRGRLYQLEVAPHDKRTHNGDPIIYGPHEHFLDEEVYAVNEIGVNCDDWDGSLDWFLRRVNVENFKVERPW